LIESNGARIRTLWSGVGIRLLSQEHTVGVVIQEGGNSRTLKDQAGSLGCFDVQSLVFGAGFFD
jgi:hypothetical protein